MNSQTKKHAILSFNLILKNINIGKVKKIKDLIEFIVKDKLNTHKEIQIGKVPKKHAGILYNFIAVDLKKAPKIIDTSAVKHTLKKHSNTVNEAKRGQLPVTYLSFNFIPVIVSEPDQINYKGRNSQGQDVFCFEKRIDHLYFVVMSVRRSKYGAKLVFSTMYIRK